MIATVWNLPFVPSSPSTLSSNTPPNFCSTDERKVEPKRKPEKGQLRSLCYEKKSSVIQKKVTKQTRIKGKKESVLKIKPKKPRNFDLRSNGTLIFQKILSKIIHYLQSLSTFFRPERKGGNFLTICYIFRLSLAKKLLPNGNSNCKWEATSRSVRLLSLENPYSIVEQ